MTDPTVTAIAVAARHGNAPDALIEMLHEVQHELGYVPEDVVPVLAKAINRSRAEVHGVVSFYHDFKREPAARHTIKICAAEACQAMNGRALIAAAEKLAKGRDIAIEKVYCLGMCATAPAAIVDGALQVRLDPKKLKALVAAL
jgi:formate dehydrogenase subunit gamma